MHLFDVFDLHPSAIILRTHIHTYLHTKILPAYLHTCIRTFTECRGLISWFDSDVDGTRCRLRSMRRVKFQNEVTSE